jgi:hypothetical protein
MDTGCTSPTKAGKSCSAAHYKDGYCRWHHPELEAQRQAERVAGGKAKSNRARAKKQLADQVMSIADLDALLCDALTKVSTGTMEPNVGSAMAGLAKTIVGIRASGDIEKRLEALEVAAGVGTIRRIG